MVRVVDLSYFYIEQIGNNQKQVGLFDARALLLNDLWYINSVALPFPRSKQLSYFPHIKTRVEKGINRDVQWGKEPLIATAQMSSLYALVAWAQEQWPDDLFSQGTFDGQELIIIRELAGKNRNISIKSQIDLAHHFATLDKDGKIIP